MSKHTPGPWSYHFLLSGSENHKGFRITNGKPLWWALATVMPVNMDGGEGQANARLIAAAPELFNLAARVARLNPDAGEIGAGMLAQLVSEARAVIAKATGEQA